ncbi:MAG: hypothetical protein ABIB43_01785 [archaeon]
MVEKQEGYLKTHPKYPIADPYEPTCGFFTVITKYYAEQLKEMSKEYQPIQKKCVYK